MPPSHKAAVAAMFALLRAPHVQVRGAACLHAALVRCLLSKPVGQATPNQHQPLSSEDTQSPTLEPYIKVLLVCPAGPSGLVDHGVHAFIVPLRDEAGRCLPGVEIHDCGYKVRLQLHWIRNRIHQEYMLL